MVSLDMQLYSFILSTIYSLYSLIGKWLSKGQHQFHLSFVDADMDYFNAGVKHFMF